MSAIIYRLTNTINGKMYIGLTTKSLEQRWRGHMSSATRGSRYHLHAAIRKYGQDAFICQILEETTTELMNDRERHWITTLSPQYNMTAGGEGMLNPAPEIRAKMAAASRGRTFSPETRAKISAAARGN